MEFGGLRLCSWPRSLLLLLVAIASAPTLAEQGLVIDATSRSPVPGAFVISNWHGSAVHPVQSNSGCYRVSLTQTGGDGSFHVDSLSGNVNPLITDRVRGVVIFKPGYEMKFYDEATVEKRIELRPFTGTFAQRLEQYIRVWQRNCPQAGTRLRPLLEAINAEAQLLARSPEEREKAAYYQLQLDIELLGYETAQRKYDETVRRIKQSGVK